MEECQQRPLINLFAAHCEMAMDARGCRLGFWPQLLRDGGGLVRCLTRVEVGGRAGQRLDRARIGPWGVLGCWATCPDPLGRKVRPTRVAV